VRFLGYPTYSLTVTLASILVFSGLGALLSKRFSLRPGRALPGLFAVLFALTLFYVFALDGVTDSLLTSALGVRIVVTLLLLAPLGLCLGMFMPLGLGLVAGLSEHADEYVAWSWAVNGFFSVIGSVLTTILAMTYGFRRVQLFGLVVYAIAALALWRLQRVAVSRRRGSTLHPGTAAS
jgi:MFS family permease